MILDPLLCILICAKLETTTITTQLNETKVETKQEVLVVTNGRQQTTKNNARPVSASKRDMGSQREQPKDEITQEIHQVFGDKAEEATKVFRCESNLEANAASRSGDFGIGQINLKAHWNKIRGQTREDKIANLYNPSYNISFSHSLYLAQSWNPWRSSRHCHKLT